MGMTIDKAKSVINELKLYVEDLHSYSADEVAEALEMAVKALEQQLNRCDSCIHSEEQDGSNCYECIKVMADNFEAQATDVDCVSREEVMKLLEKEDWADTVYGVLNLPSVTPQQKLGKWLAKSFHEVYCDNCGFDFDIMTNEFIDKMKYCPNCGAKMEIENEKETC